MFKTVIGSWSLHETSNENGIRAIDFATNNNKVIKSTHFSHKNYISRLGNPMMEELIIRLIIYWHMEGMHQASWVYKTVEVHVATWITS